MNIMLISQCSKNALVETRRILDQFAERRGERTWQTAITQNGLDTLRRLLRQTARKNTAVACHWIRGKDHSELIWIVGDARQFNERGATPTNMTRRNILRAEDENNWHSAEVIRLLASLAALFHDFGKASEAFQKKLSSNKPVADAYRHEWVSLRLFEAFVNGSDDADWLGRLLDLPDDAAKLVEARLIKDGLSKGRILSPFDT
jgi:CRISPR-associated endonuclease/helicase Cas3